MMEKYNQEREAAAKWVRHVPCDARKALFDFQNKGRCRVTDMDAGRGVGTGNRSAGGGSLKRIQSDLRAPALRWAGSDEHRREAPPLRRRA